MAMLSGIVTLSFVKDRVIGSRGCGLRRPNMSLPTTTYANQNAQKKPRTHPPSNAMPTTSEKHNE
eukprot:794001-Amphidinium_carterae.1